MQPFTQHKGVAAALLRINIDTDAIIPSREMKSVSKKGLGSGLFATWRYLDADARTPNPDFVLNKTEYTNTSILLGGDNFGCGSSREHAVWALVEYGIKAILSPGFGSIFYQNCVRNGIVPIVLDMSTLKKLAATIEINPQVNKITIDLPKQTIIDSNQNSFHFDIDAGYKTMLVEGLDAIDVTLKQETLISTFEQQDQFRRPWLQSQTL